MKLSSPIKCYLLAAIIIIQHAQIRAQPGWEVIASGTGFPKENIFFVDSLIGFVGNQGDIFQRLGRTTDGGYTWEIFPDLYISGIHFPSKSVGYLTFGTTIFKSTDLGATWDTVAKNISFIVNSIYFTDNLTGYICGGISNNSGRIAVTTDGGITWSSTNVTGLMHSIHFPSPDIGYVIGNDQFSRYIYKTTNAGLTWVSQNTPPFVGWLNQIHFASDNIGYIVSRSTSSNYGYIIKTENGGLNWYTQYSIPDNPLRSVFATSEETAYAVGANGTILKTIDGGVNWNLQTSSTTEELRTSYFLDNQTGYIAGGKQLGATYTHVILKTTTGGEPIPVELTYFTANVAGNDVNLFWTTATETNNQGFEIQRSQKSSRQSRDKSQNFESIGFVEGKGTTTEAQFYSFFDEGLEAGSYQYRLKQIDFDGTYEYSYIIEVEIGIPERFALFQNYPNPFNPTTVIRFQLPVDNFVSLKVYDILGKEVAILVNEGLDTGYHEVILNASDLSGGVYFYQLITGDITETKKLILLR